MANWMFAVFNWTTQSESAAHCVRTHNLNFAFKHENTPDSEKFSYKSFFSSSAQSLVLLGSPITFVGRIIYDQ